MADRDERIRQYEERYTEVILYILGTEDPRHPGINHYRKLCHLVKEHYTRKGKTITTEATIAEVKKAAHVLAATYLRRGHSFRHFHSGDMYTQVEQILVCNILKKL